MKHTPAPWKLVLTERGTAIWGGPELQTEVCILEGVDESTQADARLIATAPDLLAKLEEIYEWLDDIGDGAPDASSTQKRALNESGEIRTILEAIGVEL